MKSQRQVIVLCDEFTVCVLVTLGHSPQQQYLSKEQRAQGEILLGI